MRPTFLFGMERSGTTLLSMMVGSHPQIAVPLATTGMWIAFGRRLASYGHLEREEDLVRRSEEHTSELQSLMRISYAVFCLKKKKINIINDIYHTKHNNN